MSSRMFCVTERDKPPPPPSSAFPFTPSDRITHPRPLFPHSDGAWPFEIRDKSNSPDEQTRWPALQKLLHFIATAPPLLPRRYLPLPRTWLSSHCQVCLIPSCLTRCYLEPRLSGPLNPFVTHDNKKLGRRSLSGDWEEDRWTSAEVGWEEGAFAQVQGNSGELATGFFFPTTGLQISFIATVEEELRTKAFLPSLFWHCLGAFLINLGAIPRKISITTVTKASRWLEMKIWEETVRNGGGGLHDTERKNWRNWF